MSAAEIPSDRALEIPAAADLARRLCRNVERALRGKPEVVRRAVEVLVARGHLLLEDVPGVGKTTLAHALARSIDASFRRIQFTSDLLPSDLLGSSLPADRRDPGAGAFVFQPGPLFAHIVLADEVNRASPKLQSALLEAMAEGAATIEGVTHPLPQPFFVVATQNPLEHHGTHPLPESQLDRFLVRCSIGYPQAADEAALLRDDPAATTLPRLEAVLDTSDVLALQRTAESIAFGAEISDYLLRIVHATRASERLAYGVSPRGAIALRKAAQAHALVDGRAFCIPEDVQELAVPVLSHRVLLPARAGQAQDREESEWIVREILDQVSVPL